MKLRVLIVIGALLAIGGGSSMLAWGATESAPLPLVVAAKGNSTLADAKREREFDVFFVGESFEGNPLLAIDRQKAPRRGGEIIRRNTATFIYGVCEIPRTRDGKPVGGCAPPLAIEVWPACERHQALYPFSPDETLRIRGGTVAAFYEGGRRLEVYTGQTTVVLFGGGRAELLRAARALEGVNVPVRVSDPLPQPAQGARQGRLRCN